MATMAQYNIVISVIQVSDFWPTWVSSYYYYFFFLFYFIFFFFFFFFFVVVFFAKGTLNYFVLLYLINYEHLKIYYFKMVKDDFVKLI